jgi:hypothetical protein
LLAAVVGVRAENLSGRLLGWKYWFEQRADTAITIPFIFI